MEYITKKDLIDCSTPDEFCFSLCCMECKTVWKSTPIRFSKAGKKPENENRKIIYDTLYDREKNLAFQKALNQAKEIFNICPICKRLVCDHCFLICDDLDITDAIPEMEESEGSEFLLEQLHSAIGESEFIQKIQYAPHKRGDILLLTGVGDVFPFMRVHSLLEALQPHFSDIPILVMYPGEFDGHYLKLFGRLNPNDYYRAFNFFAKEDTK